VTATFQRYTRDQMAARVAREHGEANARVVGVAPQVGQVEGHRHALHVISEPLQLIKCGVQCG